jgi:hypothetical protein
VARSGQITVATAGTAVAGPDQAGNTFAFRALDANTNPVYVGSDEAAAPDTSATVGFPLHTTGEILVLKVSNLNVLRFDATTNGEKIGWIRVD